MKILVTGGAGHLGSHLCDLLVERGHEVVSVDPAHKDLSQRLHPLLTRVKAKWSLALNLTKCKRADVIYHLAAEPSVCFSDEHPAVATALGSRVTVDVLQHSAENRCKVVFVSSVIVKYSAARPYAIEKDAGEKYCQHYSKHFGVPTSIIRLNNVYGSPRHKASSGNVIPCFLEQKRTTGRITITGDGSQVRDFVHYTDAVRAIAAAADREGITEIGSCVGRSIKEVAELFDCPIDYLPRPVGEVDRQVCEHSDYPVTVDFESAVRELAGTVEEESSMVGPALPQRPGQSMAASGNVEW